MARMDWASLSFLTVAVALIVCAESAEQHSSYVTEWDMLIFTQHWPITVCQEWKETSESHTCSFPTPQDTWTIHGIWPTKSGTSFGPQYCNRTWHFDPEQVKSIETTLNQMWINIEKETSTYALWAHEWNKHGTCAAVLTPLATQLQYFSRGVAWLKQYNMTEILDEATIVPSLDKQYDITDVHKAVTDKLGVAPIIECRKDHGYSYIFEMRICFSKALELVDCEGTSTAQSVQIGDKKIITNCDTKMGIFYPPTLPTHPAPNFAIVQLYRLVTWLQWFTQ